MKYSNCDCDLQDVNYKDLLPEFINIKSSVTNNNIHHAIPNTVHVGFDGEPNQ